MSRLTEALLRAFGLLLLLAALGFAAAKTPDRPLESLIQAWAPPPSEFIDLNGQLLHIRDQGPAGDALPILLIHGTSASLHTWEGWVRELSKTRRVITIDLPGFGLTGPAATGDYSVPAYVQLVRGLLDHLQLERVVLGGNSLGGEVAWKVAAAAPARVAGLILVDASGYAFTPEAIPLGFLLAHLPVVSSLSEYTLPHKVVELSVRSVYGDPAKVSADLVERYYQLSLRAGNRAALRQRMSELPGSGQAGAQADQIKDLRQPTLILWGAKDRLIPPASGAAFARDIAGSRLVLFADLGHVPQEEDPLATLAPVQQFLSTLKP